MGRLKVLFVTYAYPPLKYPRSIQISHLVQYLRDRFDITVLAARVNEPYDHSLLDFTSLENVIYPSKTYLTRFFEKVGGHRIKLNLFPDTFYLESRELKLAAIKYLRGNAFDIIVTFGQPMSVHITGLKLKSRFSHVRWLAHFSDPWVDNPYQDQNNWVRYLNQTYQDSVIRRADKLIFTSPETIDLVFKNYDQRSKDKAVFLPHSFDPKLFVSKKEKKKWNFTISYLGNFYGERQPYSLFEALSILKSSGKLLENIRVKLIGADASYAEQAKQKGIHSIVDIKPSVDYLSSLRLMSQSDLLLVIDAHMDHSPFFPSKLADYIGAKRPIFGITPPGTSERILKGLGYLTANPNNPQEIAKNLLKMIKGVQKGQYSLTSQQQKQFSVETVGAQMADLLAQ